MGPQKGFFSTSKAEIAPFCPENRISYHFLHFESYLILKYYEILWNNPNSLTRERNFVISMGFYKKRLVKEAKRQKPKPEIGTSFSFELGTFSFKFLVVVIYVS